MLGPNVRILLLLEGSQVALATCTSIRKKGSLLIQGPPGVRQDAPRRSARSAGHLEGLLRRLPSPRGPAARAGATPGVSPELLRQRAQAPERRAARRRRGGRCAPITRDEANLFLGLFSCRDGRGHPRPSAPPQSRAQSQRQQRSASRPLTHRRFEQRRVLSQGLHETRDASRSKEKTNAKS